MNDVEKILPFEITCKSTSLPFGLKSNLPPPASERSLAENQTDKPGRDWLECRDDNEIIKNKMNLISLK